ncbi:hypothetical protein CDAR_391221 [Caerostris darwini]|uniref:Uncharacterized protein n=1 Tax=Caerostris darwini TaxID=1538125 RepID=A0AAV4SXW3_9ARAC|nr:hypothetical protein CDAR_391221 [Caerostris darwini]
MECNETVHDDRIIVCGLFLSQRKSRVGHRKSTVTSCSDHDHPRLQWTAGSVAETSHALVLQSRELGCVNDFYDAVKGSIPMDTCRRLCRVVDPADITMRVFAALLALILFVGTF